MAGLYRKVLHGIYPEMPSQYSEELCHIVGMLMQVDAKLRPSADEILQMSAVRSMSDRLFGTAYSEEVYQP